jgi:hypothetical protein
MDEFLITVLNSSLIIPKLLFTAEKTSNLGQYLDTTTQKFNRGVSRTALKAGGPIARLRYWVANSRPSNRLG